MTWTWWLLAVVLLIACQFACQAKLGPGGDAVPNIVWCAYFVVYDAITQRWIAFGFMAFMLIFWIWWFLKRQGPRWRRWKKAIGAKVKAILDKMKAFVKKWTKVPLPKIPVLKPAGGFT